MSQDRWTGKSCFECKRKQTQMASMNQVENNVTILFHCYYPYKKDDYFFLS